MEIKADKEGMEKIQALCDIALKVNGISVIKEITNILANTKIIEKEAENGSEND